MFLLKNRHEKIIEYFLQYTVWFLIIAIISTIVACLVTGSKQTISDPGELRTGYNFAIIAGQNSLVFIYILSTIFLGRMSVIIPIIINATHIGLLVSQFMYPRYMMLILPHGVLEIAVYLLLGAVASAYRNPGKMKKNTLIKWGCVLYTLLLTAAAIEAWITPGVVRFCLESPFT